MVYVILGPYRDDDQESTFERHRDRVPFGMHKHNTVQKACRHLIDITGIKEQVEKFGLGAFYKAVQVRRGRRKGVKFCSSDTEEDDEVEFQVASKTYMMQNVHLYVWIYLIAITLPAVR